MKFIDPFSWIETIVSSDHFNIETALVLECCFDKVWVISQDGKDRNLMSPVSSAIIDSMF